MSTSLTGWHAGVSSIQRKLGYDGPMAMAYTWIESSFPEQHRQFYVRNLPFIPLTTLDNEGRPWSSIVAGKSGEPGFMQSQYENELSMELELWPDDPIVANLSPIQKDPDKTILVAGLGIEFPTRRRNKFAGHIFELSSYNYNGNVSRYYRYIRITANQTIGNCPKYINVRDFDPHPNTSPQTVYRKQEISARGLDRLPQEVIDFILRSDTVFLGTVYTTDPTQRGKKIYSHVGMNARSGRPGFMRVLPSDGRTVIIPDYSGNRLMTSLGNIEANRLASLTFVDFETGDILYLTGTAQNYVGDEALEIMPRQNVLTAIRIDYFTLIRDAFPLRQRPGTSVGRSPYSPPVKYLKEEKDNETSLDEVYATLSKVRIHSQDLATFSFETSVPVKIEPGQAAVLDFTDLFGKQQYAHMAPGSETRLNDDRIRTWTVSNARGTSMSNFDLTMRERPGGLVTGALFSMARHAALRMPEVLEDARPLGLRVHLRGISGSFVLPRDGPTSEKKLLWIAGGIGVTPYISMLSAISSMPKPPDYDIAFVLATREPDVLLPLIYNALSASGQRITAKVVLHVFSSHSISTPKAIDSISLIQHKGRLTRAELRSSVSDLEERLPYLCGPPEFEDSIVKALVSAGVKASSVIREGYAY